MQRSQVAVWPLAARHDIEIYQNHLFPMLTSLGFRKLADCTHQEQRCLAQGAGVQRILYRRPTLRPTAFSVPGRPKSSGRRQFRATKIDHLERGCFLRLVTYAPAMAQ